MKTNFIFFLNAYNDLCQTSTPALNNFKWSREINGVPYTFQNSQQIQVLPGIVSPNIIPFPLSNSPASGTGTVVTGQSTITMDGSTSGIVEGQLAVGSSFPVNTFVDTVVGQVVTLTKPVTATGDVPVTFYTPASFIYFESDQPVSVIYNGGSPIAVNPFEINGLLQPGVFFIAGPCYSLTVTNAGTNTANVFLASMS